jgi:hypothetical protein
MASADGAADPPSEAAVDGAAAEAAGADGAVDAAPPLVHADTTIAATAKGAARRRVTRLLVK